MKRQSQIQIRRRIEHLSYFAAGLILLALIASAACGGSSGVPARVSENGTEGISDWRLGNFDRLTGTDYLVSPLYSTYQYGEISSKGEREAVRNYLFVNSTDKSSRWLIESNQYLFTSLKNLPLGDDNKNKPAVKWIYYELVKSDTNNDKYLNHQDRRALAVSDFAGSGYTEIINDVDNVLGQMMRDDDTLVIFYLANSKYFVSEINLPARQVTVTKELPSPPK